MRISDLARWLQRDHGAVHEPVNTGSIEAVLSNAIDSLLQIPAAVPLPLALVLLVVLYAWLARIEKQII